MPSCQSLWKPDTEEGARKEGEMNEPARYHMPMKVLCGRGRYRSWAQAVRETEGEIGEEVWTKESISKRKEGESVKVHRGGS